MILLLPAVLVSLAIAVVDAIRARSRGPTPAQYSLLLGGGAYLTAWLLQNAIRLLANAPAGRAISIGGLYVIQCAVLAVAAVPLWLALTRLSLYRAHRGDLIRILPFGLVSIGLRLSMPSIPIGLAELTALPALLRYRWHRDLNPSVRGLTSLFGFVFVVLNVIPSRLTAPAGMEGGALGGLLTYHDWVRGLAVVYVLGSLPRMLWGMELPIRSVKRRMLVSHLLAGIVPLILLALFWSLSTYLSVSGERARIAARYVTGTAAELCLALRRASGFEESGTEPSRSGTSASIADLEGWCRLQSAVWPGLRVWRRGDAGGLERVYGEPVVGEEAVAQWPRTARASGVVLLASRTYIGAACAGGTPEPELRSVALVPIGEILGAEFQRKFDAAAHIETGFLLRPEGGFTLAVPDSAQRSEARDSPFERANQTSPGAAILPAIEHARGAWHERNVLLWVSVGFFPAVRGLAQNLRENPFNVFPLILLAVVATLFVLVELLTVGMVVSMGRSVLRALSALRQGTARLRSGNFRYRIPIESNDELWEVAESFNEMAVDLDKARDLEMEKERMEGELELARQIQSRLLPAELPPVPRFDLAGLSVPARQVGGDYYDVLPLGEHRIGLITADVSGKGVPAALLMSSFRASLLSLDLGREGPAETLRRLNAFLHNSVEPGRFVTAFLAVLHLDSGRLEYSNAGHNPPFLVRENGEYSTLRDGGLVLGLFGQTNYDQSEVVVERGDLLALYTDGVTEASDEEEDLYGEERLLALLRRLRGEPCHEIVHEILGEVRAFSGVVGQADDITLLLARRRR